MADLARVFEHLHDVVTAATELLATHAPSYAADLRELPTAVDGPSLATWRLALVAARDAWHTSPRYAAERAAISAGPDGGTRQSVCAALDVLAIEAGFALLAGEIGEALLLAAEACDPRPTRLHFVRAWRSAGTPGAAL